MISLYRSTAPLVSLSKSWNAIIIMSRRNPEHTGQREEFLSPTLCNKTMEDEMVGLSPQTKTAYLS